MPFHLIANEIEMESSIRKFRDFFAMKGRAIKIYDSSITERDSTVFFLIREEYDRKLVIIYPLESHDILHKRFFCDEEGRLDEKLNYKVCSCNSNNASEIRRIFPFTKPRVMGLTPAIGTGDRIGLATPGHIRACLLYTSPSPRDS